MQIFGKDIQLLLASKSPRRQQLLKEMGFAYRLVHQDIDESYPEEMHVEDVAEYLAVQKAAAVAHELQQDHEIILASDTTVVKGNHIYGKPKNPEHAASILQQLSGDSHQVITAVCLRGLKGSLSFSASTRVFFDTLTDAEIQYYIQNCQPFDKAGAYAIQEWIGLNKISKIEGSYFNVVGLPTQQLYQNLQEYLKKFC